MSVNFGLGAYEGDIRDKIEELRDFFNTVIVNNAPTLSIMFVVWVADAEQAVDVKTAMTNSMINIAPEEMFHMDIAKKGKIIDGQPSWRASPMHTVTRYTICAVLTLRTTPFHTACL